MIPSASLSVIRDEPRIHEVEGTMTGGCGEWNSPEVSAHGDAELVVDIYRARVGVAIPVLVNPERIRRWDFGRVLTLPVHCRLSPKI